ncbi:MAG: hypothetical protein FWG74_05760 [Planctomycetes bacterium]|nr:hypothetical protein [Planctomycetota bacterium]
MLKPVERDTPHPPFSQFRAARGIYAPMPATLILLVAAALFFTISVPAGEGGDWQIMSVVRFGDIDAIDAEDGNLAAFLKSIRNDGRFPPPMRTLVGPKIRNPTFFGMADSAWIEAAILVPSQPGQIAWVWVFPVASRDDYLAQLYNQGLMSHEGMDGVTILRETGDGGARDWNLEWLPGEVAILGSVRGAVTAARRIYAENRAARGLLAGIGGSFVIPDFTLRLIPPRFVAWQNREPGRYWWREWVGLLVRDMVSYWNVTSSRNRLIRALAEDLIDWPRSLEQLDFSLWLEERGVEWQLEIRGEFSQAPPVSQLEVMRRTPDQTALAWAVPLDDHSLATIGRLAGRLLLGGAGGAVTTEARETASSLFHQTAAGKPRQLASAWIPAPADRLELGGAKMLAIEWGNPDILDGLWQMILRLADPDGPASQFFFQLGWQVAIKPEGPGMAAITIHPVGNNDAVPYYDAALAIRRNGHWSALVTGANRSEPLERRAVLDYRARVAEEAVGASTPGGSEVRAAFTRIGTQGAGFLGILDPVRFLQFCLAEEADWRPQTPDQYDSPATRFAREMLEYASGGAWTASGVPVPGGWRFGGGMSWQSLSRLAGTLGITESIGME